MCYIGKKNIYPCKKCGFYKRKIYNPVRIVVFMKEKYTPLQEMWFL